ncbi:DUF4251 domain-containing protein [Autumnicola psychrophila]|uniref:DUF4251 domain-containing protein n=1 Tax=Autumnicola psychrophila TaxID=3075592 RepID=A0ABU3DPR9_9FLAO|nr:DUF4251 domain-containing protein [Zunongwangia sp. F225]MDT0685715.1 DUF4251 domain-containing protein [Zunongwangia sp. F225]
MKKILLKLTLLGGLIFIFACSGSRNAVNEQDVKEFSKLKELVSNGFEIENQWALPLRGGRVNLIGNTNFIRFERDSVDIFLPYFGVRQSGGGYGEAGGIEYKGPAKDMEIMENLDNQNIRIQFEGKAGTENLQFHLKLYPNGNVETLVNSSQRDAISYRGDVKPLTEEKE